MNETTLQIFLFINVFVLGAMVALLVQYWRHHLRKSKQPEQTSDDTRLPKEVRERMLSDAEQHFRAVLSESAITLEQDLTDTTNQLRNRFARMSSNISSQELKQYHATLDELQREAKNTLGGLQTAVAEHQADLTKKLTERQAQLREQLERRQSQLETELNERQAELEAHLIKFNTELKEGFKRRQEQFEAELIKQQTQLKTSVVERQNTLNNIQTTFDNDLESRRIAMEQQLQEELHGKKQFLARQIETKLADAVKSYILETLQHNVDLGAQGPYLTAMLEEHKSELKKEVLS